jgi:3-deoxy-D-manno-octulosonic acid kinase
MTIQVSNFQDYTILLSTIGKSLGVLNEHFDAKALAQQNLITRTAEGRGMVYFFTLADRELVLRHYKRGGLVAKVSTDAFIFKGIKTTRCYEELAILQHLQNEMVNVPTPIAGKITRSGVFYSADIITEVIPNTRELHDLLQNQAVSKETWQAIGFEIKKMHNAQVFHGDINVKNILIASERSTEHIHLLDFDKCSIKPDDGWKMANLARFQRSLIKQSKKDANYHFHADDWSEILKGYQK